MGIISPTKNLWNNLGAQRSLPYSDTTDRTLTDRVWKSSNRERQIVADSLYISNLTVGKTYTLSFEITSINFPASSSHFFISDRANLPDTATYGVITKTTGKKTLTFTAVSKLLVIQCYLSYTLQPAGSCYFEIHDIQLEEGSTATDYVLPYIEEKIACYGRWVRLADVASWNYEPSNRQFYSPILQNVNELKINTGWNPVWINNSEYRTSTHSQDFSIDKTIAVNSNNRIYIMDLSTYSTPSEASRLLYEKLRQLDLQIIIPYKELTTEEII